MKGLILYKKRKKQKVSSALKPDMLNIIFIMSLIISGLIIGSATVTFSDVLNDKVLFIISGNITEALSVYVITYTIVTIIYLLLSLNSVGLLLIPIIPFIFGVTNGINIASVVLSLSESSLIIRIFSMIPYISLTALYIILISVNSIKLSEEVFCAVFFKNRSVNINYHILQLAKIIPVLLFSVIFFLFSCLINNSNI